MRDSSGFISVVIPAYNERAVIEQAVEEVERVLSDCMSRWEIIIVDDGSSDGTIDKVRRIVTQRRTVRAVRLSRNFGKESAILAGLRAASGDAVLTIDADLQHPPALIPEMVRCWRNGAKVVNGVKRNGLGANHNLGRAMFNASMGYLAHLDLKDASDFKLLDRLVVNAIVHDIPERARFYRGLTYWVGYEQVTIPFDVAPRAGGETKWSYWGLIKLAASALISFSVVPLRIVTILGLATLLLGLLVGTDAILSWNHGEAVSGFATIVITLCFIGSSIMLSLGIIGEYIGRIFHETKRRPAYLIDTSLGFDDEDGGPGAHKR